MLHIIKARCFLIRPTHHYRYIRVDAHRNTERRAVAKHTESEGPSPNFQATVEYIYTAFGGYLAENSFHYNEGRPRGKCTRRVPFVIRK